MDAFIASDDSLVTTKLRDSLRRSGVDCPSSRILSSDPIGLLLARATMSGAAVIFFASRQYTSDDWSLLGQLCATGDKSVKIVAVGSNLSPGVILQAIRCGASDCIDLNGDLEVELREVMQRVAVVSQNGCHWRQLFTVLGPVGGAGASLIAANLAIVLAQRGQRIGLLDLHFRGGDLATLLKCEPRHTIASLAAQGDQFDQAMFEQSLIAHKSGMQLLASSEPFSDVRSIRPELILKVVQFARHTFQQIVVDLEDCEHDEQVRVLAASDCIVLVLRPDFVAVHRARKCLEFLSRAKVPSDHIMIVANRLGSPKALSAGHMEDALGMSIQHRLPEEADPVNESYNLGVPLVVAHANSKVAQGIVQLADALSGHTTAAPTPNWARRQVNRMKSVLTQSGAGMK